MVGSKECTVMSSMLLKARMPMQSYQTGRGNRRDKAAIQCCSICVLYFISSTKLLRPVIDLRMTLLALQLLLPYHLRYLSGLIPLCPFWFPVSCIMFKLIFLNRFCIFAKTSISCPLLQCIVISLQSSTITHYLYKYH